MQKKLYHVTLVFFFFILSGCSNMFYQPDGRLFYPPEQFGLKPEEVVFPSKTGKKLFAWYFATNKKPKANIVLYHGNAQNISSHYISIIWLLNYGYNIFAFDYQGYGRSEGEPTQDNTIADGEAALEWISKKNNLPLVIFGQSLGGAIAQRNVIDLKNKYDIKLLILDSTFSSYPEVGRKFLNKHWVSWPFQWLTYALVSNKQGTNGEVKNISPIPLLVIHGDQDEVVDFSCGQGIFDEASEPKTFWRIPGGKHTDALTRESSEYRLKLAEYLNKYFP